MTLQAATLLASALLLISCGTESPRQAEAATEVRTPVRTITAALREWPSVYEATGTVRARTATVISSRITGYVQQVAAGTGDRVSAGQTLITLDARDLNANYSRAEAGRAEVESAIPEADSGVAAAHAVLDLAQATFKRMQELYTKKSISEQEFDEASSRLHAAQASYEMARAKRTQVTSRLEAAEQEKRAAAITRDYARITAPFAGIVTARSVEPGNLAAMGMPLLTIERAGAYRLEASVAESKLAGVRTGQAVSVSIDAPGCNGTARVSEIVPVVDPASRSYIVKLDLPSAGAEWSCSSLRSGLFGRAMFSLVMRHALVVPASAVVERGQVQSVFIADNGIARLRLVTTGDGRGDAVEILSGMNGGEAVIAPVPAGLSDGAGIEVRP